MTTICHDASPVSLRGVTVSYGRKATPLRDLDLEVAHGEVTVLLGANGAGKSTLFRTLLGLVRPSSGAVRLQGYCPYREHGRAVDRVGFVPDVPDVPKRSRPRQMFRLLARIDAAWDGDECARLIERFQVPLDRPFQKLSRGEGMKAMLVAALSIRPRVLLLDEPFAGLDPMARDDVLELVVDAIAHDEDAGPRTVLCATHDLDVATRLADRIAVLEGGRILRYEPVAAFADGATRPVDLKNALASARMDLAVEEVGQ